MEFPALIPFFFTHPPRFKKRSVTGLCVVQILGAFLPARCPRELVTAGLSFISVLLGPTALSHRFLYLRTTP